MGQPVVSWAAGGIVSNARDLSRFYSALLSGRILSGNSLASDEEDGRCRPGGGYGLGIASIGVRCGRSWGHGGGILDYGTLALASEKGDRVGVISIYGAVSTTPPDESALVCQEYRLAPSAATSRIAFLREPAQHRPLRRERRRQRAAATRTRERARLVARRPQDRLSVRSGGIHVMNADGRAQQRLARGSTPAWSPDGRQIAFLRSGAIYVMNADGTRQRRLARGSAPAWSPDGRRIVFVREQGGDAEIYVMNADGSGQRNLTRNAADEDDPAWSPDGRRIAFARRSPSSVGLAATSRSSS